MKYNIKISIIFIIVFCCVANLFADTIPELNLKLRLALTESHIYHPWGLTPPLDYLDFVNRGFFPDANGITIDLVNNNSVSQDYTIDLSEYDILDVEHCELVAFIESDYDKYVYQSTKLGFSPTSSIISNNTPQMQVFPNPCNDKLNIKLDEFNGNKAIFNITDITGKVLLSGTLKNKISIDVSHFSNGCYFIEVETDNHKTINKFVKIK